MKLTASTPEDCGHELQAYVYDLTGRHRVCLNPACRMHLECELSGDVLEVLLLAAMVGELIEVQHAAPLN